MRKPIHLAAAFSAALFLAACGGEPERAEPERGVPAEPDEAAGAAAAPDEAADAAAASEDGFIELFDGESLAGWTPSVDNPDCYTVEDGVLIVKGGPGHLYYTGEVNGGVFKDFEMKVEIMTMPGANSGVYFHTEYQDDGWPEVGHEAQVNGTHRDPRKTGSLYRVADVIVLAEGQDKPEGSVEQTVYDEPPHADGEWFDYSIKVQGNRIVIAVDGEVYVDFEEPEGGALPDRPKRSLSEGTFAIQAHDPDSEIHYRRIAVRPL